MTLFRSIQSNFIPTIEVWNIFQGEMIYTVTLKFFELLPRGHQEFKPQISGYDFCRYNLLSVLYLCLKFEDVVSIVYYFILQKFQRSSRTNIWFNNENVLFHSLLTLHAHNFISRNHRRTGIRDYIPQYVMKFFSSKFHLKENATDTSCGKCTYIFKTKEYTLLVITWTLYNVQYGMCAW